MKWLKLSSAIILAPGLALSLTILQELQADEPPAMPITNAPAENHFRDGLWEMSAGQGVMFSPFLAVHNRPELNYTLTEIQLGYMLTDIHGSDFWRGNVEAAGSSFGGGIFNGRGSYVAGSTLWLRYNFVPRTGHFVPFVQAGAGLTDTDLDRRIEGQNFNFNLNLGAGTRYFFKPNWSVNLECRYQHISNADMSPRNLGVNAIGPMLSLSYFF
jgi:opacity protein-like surface antigen